MRNPQNKRTWKSWRGEKRKGGGGAGGGPRKLWGECNSTRQMDQLIICLLICCMCQCCGLPHVTDFRILKIVSSPSSGVLNNHKGEILPFCSETKIEISVCVPSLTRAHNPPICKPSNFGEEQQQQVRKSIFRKNDNIFSKTLAVDKSFWTATNTSPTAWVKKGSYSTYGSWRHLFLC